MQTYLNQKAFDYTVPLVDPDGNAVIATEVQWTLFDEKEQTVISGVIATTGTDTEVVISLTAEECTITNGKQTEVRLLRVTIVTADNEFTNNDYFMLANTQSVVPGENSFLTYLEALRLMPEFPQFVAFTSATEQERKNALIAAYRNIGNIELLRGSMVENDANETPLLTEDKSVPLWTTLQLTPALYAKLHDSIKRNLGFAQIVEAEYLLGGDGNEDLRSKGVMSYSVGEVKQFFRTSKPIELSVSKHALRYIGRYVQYNRSLTRV